MMRLGLTYTTSILTVALVLLGSGPMFWATSPVLTAPSTVSSSLGVPASLTVGAPIGIHLNEPFYAVNFGASASTPKSQAAYGQFFNSTPITMFRLGGGNDGYDPTTQTNHVAPISGSAYVAVPGLLVNFTWFKAWCDSKTPHCSWMTYLPGELNDTRAAVHAANWFHKVLGFAPTLWQFGNEPTAWTHYGKNWTVWSTNDAITPSGMDYATMVKKYIAAIAALYPSDQYVGVQASCACNPNFLTPLLTIDGPKLAAIAYHNYPFLNGSDTVVSQFFGALNSSRAIANTSTHLRSIISTACPTCTNIPIEIGEYQAGGPVPDHSPFANQFPGAAFIAASVIEAIQSNISMFTLFDNAWMINQTSGLVGPEGLLYSYILKNMTMGTDYSVSVNVVGVGGVFALLVKNGTRESLLIVNTNSTKTLTLSMNTGVFPVHLFGSAWVWSPVNAHPVTHLGILIPRLYTIVPEQILLLNNF